MAPVTWLLLGFLLLVGAASQPALAQTSDNPPAAVIIKNWEKALAEADAYIAGDRHTAAQHERYRTIIAKIIQDARALSQSATKDMEASKQLLDALGSPPEAGEATEPVELAAKRKKIQEDIAAYKAQAAQADLIVTSGKALDQTFKDVFRQQVLQALVERYPLPLGEKFQLSLNQVRWAITAIIRAPFDWYQSLSPEQRFRLWTQWQSLFALAALLAGYVGQRLILRRFGPVPAIVQPSYPRRLAAAIAKAVARGVLPAAFVGVIYLWSISESSQISGVAADVVANFCRVFGGMIIAITFPRAVLSPTMPTWRCAPLTSAAAKRLYRRLVLVAIIFALHRFYTTSANAVSVNFGVEALPETKTLYALIFIWLAGPAMLLVSRDAAWQRLPRPATTSGDEEDPEIASISDAGELLGGRAWRLTRAIIAALIVVGMAAATAGYIRFGYYIIDNIIFTFIVFGLLFFLHNAVGGSLEYILKYSPIQKRLQLSKTGREAVQFWGGLFLDIALAITSILLVAPSWGVPRSMLSEWGRTAAEGVTVGNVTISVVDIIVALLIFIAGLFITRLMKTMLSGRVLPRTSLDYGVRNSIATGVGYVGAILSLLIAVAALGINMSNLAILGGALGVGIGFGLQNIVNNFVSGLIMLIERPISVGDLVVAGDKQGHVRRISVRATMIETLDGASVIIPNSEFISSPVVNWTHANRIARVEVRVGVNYGTDPEKVIALLLECAKNHPDVVAWPKSNAFFVDFGANSLDFLLLAHVADVDKRMSVGSAIRLAIDKSFREAGLEIPFGQVDVHLKDIDRLEAVISARRHTKAGTRAASERIESLGIPKGLVL